MEEGNQGGNSGQELEADTRYQWRFAPRHTSDTFILFLLLFFFIERVSLCNPGLPVTCYVDQAGLELTETCLLGFKACIIMLGPVQPTCPGMAPSTVGFYLPRQLAIKKMPHRAVWSKQFFRWGSVCLLGMSGWQPNEPDSSWLQTAKGGCYLRDGVDLKLLPDSVKGSRGHLVYWTLAEGLGSSGTTDPAFVNPELLRTEWSEKLLPQKISVTRDHDFSNFCVIFTLDSQACCLIVITC